MRSFLFSCLFLLCFLPVFAQHKSVTAQHMRKAGLIDVKDLDSTIKVSLMYGRSDNFTGKILYKDLREAYLYPAAAKALAKAQKELKRLYPQYSLVIYDAARPMHIQQTMWNAVSGTPKNIYVSNPSHGGGLHNYGLAVDITICDEKGDTIPMGTRIDYMGKRAHIDAEQWMMSHHQLSRQEYYNRSLLRRVMRAAGFKPLRTEWWHFNFKSRKEAKAYYKVIK